MKTRATVTISPEVLRGSRRLARKRGTNVSALIEDLLSRELAGESNQVNRLIGSAELRDPKGDSRFDALVAKHVHQ